jgi:aspartyl protease family protein
MPPLRSLPHLKGPRAILRVMWKQVMPLFVVAVLAGWFMPAQLTPKQPAVADAAAAAAKESPKVQAQTAQPRKPNLPPMPGDAVVLDRQADGHFYAEANANAQPLRIRRRQGDNAGTSIDQKAQRLGMMWNQNELQLIGRGVNGDVMGKPVEIAELRIGGLAAYNVRAVIIPYGLDVSLLGQSFLSQVGHVAISGNQMTLRN